MEGLTDLMGEAGTVAYAFIGALILVFFVSPVAGMLMGNVIKSRTATFLGLAMALGIFSVLSVVLVRLIPRIIGEDTLNADLVAILGLVIALIIALPAGMYIIWMFSPPKSELDHFNYNNTDTTTSLSFEEKRNERLKKRGKR